MNAVRQALNIADRYQVALVIGLGRPSKQVVLETVDDDEDVRYWRDSGRVHHVPRRALEQIIV